MLQQLLTLLGIVTGAIADSASGKVAEGAEAAEYLLKIAKASIAAYEAQVGQPIDPALLHQEAPIGVPPTA
jgi:hypothetical protein